MAKKTKKNKKTTKPSNIWLIFFAVILFALIFGFGMIAGGIVFYQEPKTTIEFEPSPFCIDTGEYDQ